MKQAIQAGRRNGSAPKRLTFSWVYPLILTHRCAYKCGYCPFPATAGPALPSKRELQAQFARARELGLFQIRVTGGEDLENHPEIASTFRFYGFRSFVEYLKGVLGEAAQNKVVTPLFPELDLGALALTQMQQLRANIFTLRLYLDTMDDKLATNVAHGHSEGKQPKRRLEALIAAGRLGIPVNSGVMIGIGERPESRADAFAALAEVARRYGHIQSVSIHPFRPMPRTQMSDTPAPTLAELVAAVELARKTLPARVAVQFPVARYAEHALDFVRAGAGDLGDFEMTGDPARDAPVLNAFRVARDRLAGAGYEIADRLSLFPAFSSERWLPERYQHLLRTQAESPAPVLAPSA